MQKTLLNAFIFASAILLSIAMAFAADDDQNVETREQLDELRSKISKVTQTLNESLSEQQALNADLRKTEIELGELSRERDITDTAIIEQRKRLEQFSQQQLLLEQERNTQQLLIEKQLVSNWQLGRQNDLKLLLSQESPNTVSRIMIYANYLNAARLDLMTQHKKTLADLENLTINIKSETEKLMSARLMQEKNRQALDQERQTRQATLAELEKSIATQDARLKSLIQDRNALEALLKSVEEAIVQLKPEGAISLPFNQRTGQMKWPIKGKRIHNFGDSRESGKLRWDGVVIKAGAGTQVKAIHQGRVIFADWFRGMGLLVIIDHGDGYLSLYAHNQSLLRDTGEWVQPGDTIATVGDSGGQSNSNLYFEIRNQGRPVNPALWCK